MGRYRVEIKINLKLKVIYKDFIYSTLLVFKRLFTDGISHSIGILSNSSISYAI